MWIKKMTYNEVIEAITEAYETLDGDELAEEYNHIYPSHPVGYDGNGEFSRSIEGIRVNNEN